MTAAWDPPSVDQPEAEPSSPRKNRRYAALGVTAGLLGGGAIGLMLGVPGLTSAATDEASSADTAIVVDDAAGDTTGDTGDAAEAGDHGARLREALQPLVDDGTISAAQADAVAEHLAANRPEGGRGGGHGGRPGFDGEVVAELLGIDAATLRSELVAGKTIAEIATDQGVDPQTVIDALVAEADSHLDLSVTNGRLTQAEADAKLAEITERITDRVNNGGPIRSGRGPAADTTEVAAESSTDTAG